MAKDEKCPWVCPEGNMNNMMKQVQNARQMEEMQKT